jgi:hypothetical protein
MISGNRRGIKKNSTKGVTIHVTLASLVKLLLFSLRIFYKALSQGFIIFTQNPLLEINSYRTAISYYHQKTGAPGAGK